MLEIIQNKGFRDSHRSRGRKSTPLLTWHGENSSIAMASEVKGVQHEKDSLTFSADTRAYKVIPRNKQTEVPSKPSDM